MTDTHDMMEDPVIESTGTLPILIRIRDVILTILMWLMYIYFMRNFFAFMGDFFSWVFHGFADAASYPSFQIIGTLTQYFKIIILMGLLFIGWAVYNKVRFGKKKRRLPPAPIEASKIASAYGLKMEDLAAWQESRIMVMHLTPDGRLTKVDQVATE